MSRRIAALVVMGIALGIGSAYGQETSAEPALVEVTFMPAGAAYFASKGDAPSFGNYGFGTAVTFNLNRYIGVEGEVGSMIATTSDLQFGDLPGAIKAPNKRWGLRGDYRFAVTKSKDGAPEFFGRDDRYAHRVYGGVIINTVR